MKEQKICLQQRSSTTSGRALTHLSKALGVALPAAAVANVHRAAAVHIVAAPAAAALLLLLEHLLLHTHVHAAPSAVGRTHVVAGLLLLLLLLLLAAKVHWARHCNGIGLLMHSRALENMLFTYVQHLPLLISHLLHRRNAIGNK